MNTNEIVNKIVEHILAAPYGEDIITYDVASKVIHDLQTEYRGQNDGHVYTNGEVEIKGVDMFDIGKSHTTTSAVLSYYLLT